VVVAGRLSVWEARIEMEAEGELGGEPVEALESAGEWGGGDEGPLAVAEAFFAILCSIKL